jgi:hypothetical protein
MSRRTYVLAIVALVLVAISCAAYALARFAS